MTFISRQAKMLICQVGRHKGEVLVEAAKAAGARGGTITFARTEGDNPILQMLSLADVHQDIVFLLMNQEAPAVLDAIRNVARKNPKKLHGLAIIINVPAMLVRGLPTQQNQQSPDEGEGRNTMDSGYEMITIITNSGYGDDVMAAARKAGATGGTILNARGTGTEEDVKFFGISLVPEKEMLLIVAAKDKVSSIVSAVTNVPKLNEPGGGIVFTTQVEEFMILGK